MTKEVLFPMLLVLCYLSMSDLGSRHVPLRIVGFGFVVRSFCFFFEGAGPETFFAALLKCVPVLLTSLLIVLLSDRLFGKKTAGGGDLWFMALLLFSFPFGITLPGIFFGLLLGLIPIVSKRICGGKAVRIPLTPYLMIGLEVMILLRG